MSASRPITWGRLRVFFGALLLVLFASGGLLVYASFRHDRASGHGRTDLRTLGVELIALSIIAAVFAAVLTRRLSRDA